MSDPVCDESGPGTYWTTTNISEGLPGVLSPLTWSLWGPNMEASTRRAMVRLGIFPRRELDPTVAVDERFGAIFFGRAALNVDTYRRVADLTPGMGAESAELQLLGSVRAGVPSASTWRRLPVVLARMPVTMLAAPRRLRRFLVTQRAWWWAQVRPDHPSVSTPVARLAAASEQLDAALEHHCIASMLSLAAFSQVEALAAKAGHPGLEAQLVTGYGGLEEQEAVSELWALARGEATVEEVIAHHGFQGPGELSAASWREQPAELERLVAGYRSLGDGSDADAVADRQGDRRRESERELLAALPRSRRVGARLVLRTAAKVVPLREAGKAGFLMALDAARAAARELGAVLAADGSLERSTDVFFLTLPELLDVPPGSAALAAERRSRGEDYERVELPRSWMGQPVPAPPVVDDAMATQVTGIGVSPGRVEGVARVARTIEEARELQAGEVLVCHTTDPSWASVFPLVEALAIDVGSTASHGAIVAREFGIPCVINTERGTGVFVTGDRVVLDGAAGTVDLLERAT